MKTLGKLVAIAMVFALSGCGTQQPNEPRQPTRAKTRGGIKQIGSVIVQRIPGGAPIGVRQFRVLFHCAADAAHPTEFNVDGGTPQNVPTGRLPVTSVLHTWNFNALLPGDTDPPSKTLAIAPGELVVFRIHYQ